MPKKKVSWTKIRPRTYEKSLVSDEIFETSGSTWEHPSRRFRATDKVYGWKLTCVNDDGSEYLIKDYVETLRKCKDMVEDILEKENQ